MRVNPLILPASRTRQCALWRAGWLAVWAPLWCFSLSVWAASPKAGTPTPAVFQAQLSNGMQLWMQVDKRAPVVVHMLAVRVGTLDEVPGKTGLAHALEHLMFKGSRRLAEGEFSKRVAALGGIDNAFTTTDMTAYYQVVPKQQLASVMRLEADRFATARFSDAAFTREMQVIREERRLRVEDQPFASLREQLMAKAYPAHPSGQPIIGHMTDLERLQADDARCFYRSWYQPNNAVILVVGDVEPRAVLRQAQRVYATIRPHPKAANCPAVTRVSAPEPEQTQQRSLQWSARARDGQWLLAWQVPRLRNLAAVAHAGPDRDALALVLLSTLLDGHDYARLPRALSKTATPLARSTFSYFGLWGRGPQPFLLGLTPSASAPTAMTQALLGALAVVEEVRTQVFSEAEVQRAKRQWRAQQVYGRDALMAMTRQLAQAWALRQPANSEALLLRALDHINARDVQEAAMRYLIPEHLTMAQLTPQASPGKMTPSDPAE